MDTEDFYVCLDARSSNISLLRRLVNHHLRAAGIAKSGACKTQASVVRAFATAVRRSSGKQIQIEVQIQHDPDPSVELRQRQ